MFVHWEWAGVRAEVVKGAKLYHNQLLKFNLSQLNTYEYGLS